jgi:hypothetical protein
MEGGKLIDNHKHKQSKEGCGTTEKKKDVVRATLFFLFRHYTTTKK